jgi:predicted phage terminase large subunit-like protein
MLLEIQRERIRREGLMAFVRAFWSDVESAELVEEPHMPLICRHLEACLLRASRSLKPKRQPWMDGLEEIKDLVIAIPPGCSKSLLSSVFFPAWAWSVCPSLKIITTSYSEVLVTRDAKRSFELMTGEKYRTMFPEVEIVGGERAAMTAYWTTAKGMRYATPMGGSVLGTHAHLLMVDDYLKIQDLQGDAAAALAKVNEKWDNIFSSRSAHPATFTRVIIAQRLHFDDLSGVMINRGAQHLCLPMEMDPERLYKSQWGNDWRTEPGELLLPNRFPQDVIDFRKGFLPAREWSSQYLQAPAPADGSLFLREWFSYRYPFGTYPWGSNPIFLSVDSSHKETSTSDYTVIQAWSAARPRWFLVDQIRARMGFAKQCEAIMTLRSRYANVRNILVEAKANGEAIIQTLQKQMPGVIAVHPQGGKEARAAATEWLWNSGSVWLPEGAPWLDQFVDEHLQFPVGRNDDCVDAATQALIWSSARDRSSLLRQAMKVQSANLKVGRSPF